MIVWEIHDTKHYVVDIVITCATLSLRVDNVFNIFTDNLRKLNNFNNNHSYMKPLDGSLSGQAYNKGKHFYFLRFVSLLL